MQVEWSKPIEQRVRGTLGQVASPAPPGWTGPWPPPKPPFWDLTGMSWLPTGDFPAQAPFGWEVTGLSWPPPRPPGYPAGWDWPLKPPPGWLAPPTSAPSSSPGSPPPVTPGTVPSSSSDDSGDSIVYVVGGALVIGLFLILFGGDGAALQENAAGDPRVYLSRVRLDRQGYDSRGAYFGVGKPLYRYVDDSGQLHGYVRAYDREAAKAEVRAKAKNKGYAGVNFYRG